MMSPFAFHVEPFEFESELDAEWPDTVRDALARGKELIAVNLAIARGMRGEDKLTDRVFFERHPERGERRLRGGEPDFDKLSEEWRQIRDQLVRPPLFKKFFAEYDFRFLRDDLVLGIPANADMTPAQKSQRVADLNVIAPLLAERAIARFDAATTGLAFIGKPVPGTAREQAKRLSLAQIALIREFFSDERGVIRLSAFQQAFEQFANGELRNPLRGSGAGEPDGGAYFLFAEFAWLCVESDIHIDFWATVLRAFVKTQEIFVRVYRPEPGSPGSVPPSPTSGGDRFIFERYTFGNFRAARQFDEAAKQPLRARYDRMSLDELRKAMRDNMRQAQQFNSQ
jgi:hypothetical protein